MFNVVLARSAIVPILLVVLKGQKLDCPQTFFQGTICCVDLSRKDKMVVYAFVINVQGALSSGGTVTATKMTLFT